jgi:hypothetical protein
MIAFAPPPPQLGGLAPGLRPVADLHMSRSFDWQLMPFALRLVAFEKCGSVLVPEQFVTVLATT